MRVEKLWDSYSDHLLAPFSLKRKIFRQQKIQFTRVYQWNHSYFSTQSTSTRWYWLKKVLGWNWICSVGTKKWTFASDYNIFQKKFYRRTITFTEFLIAIFLMYIKNSSRMLFDWMCSIDRIYFVPNMFKPQLNWMCSNKIDMKRG